MVVFLVLASGCTATSSRSGDADSERRTIDANVDNALSRVLGHVEWSEQLLADQRRRCSVSISSPWWFLESYRGRNADIIGLGD